MKRLIFAYPCGNALFRLGTAAVLGLLFVTAADAASGSGTAILRADVLYALEVPPGYDSAGPASAVAGAVAGDSALELPGNQIFYHATTWSGPGGTPTV